MKRILILTAILVVQYSFAGTVSYLRFEENGGATAYDETGLLDGEFNSFMPTEPGGGDTGFRGWSTDVPGASIPQTGVDNNGSIRFAGGSEYIDLSNYNDLLLGYSFTIEMFIKPDDPNISVLFGLSPGAGLSVTISESLGEDYFNLNFMGQMPYALATGLQIDEWQHFALVKEPGLYRIYLDGVLAAQDSLPASSDGPYDFPGTGIIGDRTLGGPSGTWSGYIDEFRISDEALTPDQFLNASIPEPGTSLLIGMGLLCLIRKRSKPHS